MRVWELEEEEEEEEEGKMRRRDEQEDKLRSQNATLDLSFYRTKKYTCGSERKRLR